MTKKSADQADTATRTSAAAKSAAPRKKIQVLTTESPTESLGRSTEKTKKPAFLERALLRTDVKKRDAKPAIEAALAELSAALLAGEELVLPPLGKLKVVKTKDVGQGAFALTLKLRTMKTEVADFSDRMDDV